MFQNIKDYFQKNETLVAFVVPIFLSFIFLLSKFIVFSINKGYFDYFNIDINFYKSNFDVEISNLILNTITFLLFILSIAFFYKSFNIKQPLKDKIREVSTLFFLIFIINFLSLFLFTLSLSFINVIIISFIYTLFKLIIALMQVSKKNPKTSVKKLAVSKHYIFIRIFFLFFIFFLIVGSFYKIGVMKAENKTQFYVTEESQVVLYMNDEYAVVSKFTTDKNIIIINVYEKRKIAMDNLKLNSINFDSVILKKMNKEG